MPCPSLEAPPEDEAPASTTHAAHAAHAAPDNLARLVAHAINNPLAALLLDLDSAVELLEADLSGDEGESRIEDARRLLGEMRKSAMRVHAVVEDLRRTRSTADAVDVLSVAPVDDAAPNAAPRVAPKAAVAHVLVVDDDALVASAVKRSLREHDVVVQGSARDALELFERGQRFDIVLCDLMMPDVTGMDLYDAVSKIDPAQAARMVFVTGGAVTARAREFVATTENQVLDKPFDVRKLREIIARNLK